MLNKNVFVHVHYTATATCLGYRLFLTYKTIEIRFMLVAITEGVMLSPETNGEGITLNSIVLHKILL